MKDKTIVEEETQRLIGMTAGFCDAYLNEDYKQLCEKLIRKMSRKRNVPFLSGRVEIWADAGIFPVMTPGLAATGQYPRSFTSSKIVPFLNI